ncbi:MAG: chemotaxis protein CheD [Arenibacterium sp.]
MKSNQAVLRADGTKVLHVIQGEHKVSSDPQVILTTILGSCVATCMCDPVAKVGGLNHFLLPDNGNNASLEMRYGLLAMELLINGLLKMGASRNRLEAKLFGGANMNSRLAHIGASNSNFALKFLQDEGIPCISKSLGGNQARRIRYIPTKGSAQQRLLSNEDSFVPEERPANPPDCNDVTLF